PVGRAAPLLTAARSGARPRRAGGRRRRRPSGRAGPGAANRDHHSAWSPSTFVACKTRRRTPRSAAGPAGWAGTLKDRHAGPVCCSVWFGPAFALQATWKVLFSLAPPLSPIEFGEVLVLDRGFVISSLDVHLGRVQAHRVIACLIVQLHVVR